MARGPVASPWDRGNAGATGAGGARPRHDGDMRAKSEGGVAVDDGARGAGGVAVVGVQRACSSGGEVWAKMGDAAGTVTGDGVTWALRPMPWRP